MLVLDNAVPSLFLFTMSFAETIGYTILVTIKHGNDAGSYILTLALVAYMIMLILSAKKPPENVLIPAIITFTIIFMVQGLDFTYFNIKNAFPNKFYLIHYSIYSATSLIVLVFVSFVVQKKTNRFQAKAAQKNAYLSFSAGHDALTKILNRRKATQIISDFATKPEYSGIIFTTAIFDIDFFKKVNDTYGHDCGDIVLKNIAGLVQRSLPDNTIFARWGGEEFLIIFIGTPDNAAAVLEDIRSKIEDRTFKYLDKFLKITITIGMSSHEKPTKFAQMLIEADNNLLEGKRTGKNRVVTGENKS